MSFLDVISEVKQTVWLDTRVKEESLPPLQRSNLWGLPTQWLSLQRPHFLCGGSQEALQAFNNRREVGHQ